MRRARRAGSRLRSTFSTSYTDRHLGNGEHDAVARVRDREARAVGQLRLAVRAATVLAGAVEREVARVDVQTASPSTVRDRKDAGHEARAVGVPQVGADPLDLVTDQQITAVERRLAPPDVDVSHAGSVGRGVTPRLLYFTFRGEGGREQHDRADLGDDDELDRRPPAGLLPAEQALAVAHDQAAERDRGRHYAGESGDCARAPHGEVPAAITRHATALATNSGPIQSTAL